MQTRIESLRQMPRTVRGRLSPRRHTALLVAILVVFTIRPMVGNTGIASVVLAVSLAAVGLLGLYNIQVDELIGDRTALIAQRKRRLLLGWLLGFGAVAGRVIIFYTPQASAYLAVITCWLLFFCFITWHELNALLREKYVTEDTIALAISVYLLLGLTWSILYILIYQINPEAFALSGLPKLSPYASPLIKELSVFPVITYFSLTTLSTVGFGDISPVSMSARYFAVAEGITGQFYLAILVARLVAMQMSQSSQPRDEDPRDGC